MFGNAAVTNVCYSEIQRKKGEPCRLQVRHGLQICSETYTRKKKIAFLTDEPAVQWFSRESEAFGSSFSKESVYVSSIQTFWLFCHTSDSFYR